MAKLCFVVAIMGCRDRIEVEPRICVVESTHEAIGLQTKYVLNKYDAQWKLVGIHAEIIGPDVQAVIKSYFAQN